MFERIAQQLADRSYAIVDHFISAKDCELLRKHIEALQSEDALRLAGTGSAHLYQKSREVRGDLIQWIDRQKLPSPILNTLQPLLQLPQSLAEPLRAPLRDIEIHFTYYPIGRHYVKHLDVHQTNNHRLLSAILYLNENWQEKDGGALRIYLDDTHYEDILPTNGRLVLFASHALAHEVLPTNRPRFSITGWLLNTPNQLSYL